MNRVPSIKPNVKVRKEAFGALIFTNRTPILALNSDSFLIWGMIDGNRNIAQIIADLRVIEQDVSIDDELVVDFVVSCEELDLIEFR